MRGSNCTRYLPEDFRERIRRSGRRPCRQTRRTLSCRVGRWPRRPLGPVYPSGMTLLLGLENNHCAIVINAAATVLLFLLFYFSIFSSSSSFVFLYGRKISERDKDRQRERESPLGTV